jgi:hypothetical protein
MKFTFNDHSKLLFIQGRAYCDAVISTLLTNTLGESLPELSSN